MKRRLAIPALLALALVVPAQGAAAREPLLPPPLASSQPLSHESDRAPRRPFFRSGFVVDASGGLQVGVSTAGNAVVLQVWRGRKGKRTATAYLARGVSAPERLQATFGELGRISMRFRESRNRTWLGKRRRCRGKNRFVKRRGVFVGSLRFRGEGGYVTVRIGRAKGAVVTEAKKCRGRGLGGLPDLGSFFFFEPEVAFLALARDGVDSTSFLALGGKRKTHFLATDEETRGELAIVRSALLRSSQPLRVNEAITAARFSPSAPFQGTGRYRAAPDGTATWTGDLTVNFPGAPRFPLTGPDFKPLIEVGF